MRKQHAGRVCSWKLCAAGSLLLAATAFAGLYDTWNYSSTIQFSGYSRGETLSNFPVLVILSTANISGFDYSQFLSGSNADLRFTDSTGLVDLNYEVEKWDTSGNSYVWVQVPALVDATTAIVACWGMAGQSAPPCTTNGSTWSSDFRGVWHLQTPNAPDATTNRNAGAANSNTNAAGLVGSAQGFNGSSAFINCSNNASVQVSGKLTLSCWINPYNITGERGLVSKWSGAWCWVLNRDGNSVQGRQNLYFNGWKDAGTAAGVNAWSLVTVAYDSTTQNMYFYLNGRPDGTQGQTANPGTGGNLEIGRRQNGGAGYFSGLIDEARLESVARSSNWVWACYMTVASNASAFQAYGAATASSGPRPPVVSNLAASNVVAGAAFLNGRIASTGNAPVTAVALYWGTANGGTNADLWANTNVFSGGPWNQNDLLTTNITTLAADQNYYYAYFATNSDGGAWGKPAQYFISGALSLSATDAVFGASLADTATIVVSRPDTCTNEALQVYYALGGTAAIDKEYTISPASGFTFPAGQTNAAITVTPLWSRYFGAPKNVTVSLTPGLYAIGSPGSATCDLIGQQPSGYAGAKIDWNDGDGASGTIASAAWGTNNTLDYAVWDQIQDAIALAGNNPATPGTIRLAGNFVRTTDDPVVGALQFTIANLTLSGGWDSTFTSQNGRSILNVNGSSTGNNQFRVLTLSATNVLVQNVVVTNGWFSGSGGGVYISGDSATLQNLVIVRNTASGSYDVGRGGGIAIVDAAGVSIRRSTIINNTGQSLAGGISMNNVGLAASPVVIQDCVVASNTCVARGYTMDSVGGGILFGQSSGNPTKGYAQVLNTQIIGNRAKNGAGIYSGAWDTSTRLMFFGCLIAGNYSLRKASDSYGGGTGNALRGGGDGITILANCTLANNTHPEDAGQYGICSFAGGWGMYGRVIFINSITASNNLGVFDERQNAGYGVAGAHIDYLRSTLLETEFHELDQGPNGGPVPPNVDQSTNTLAGALVFANPGFHSLTDTGSVSQAMEQNIDGAANFSGKGSAPYQLSALSANALDNGLTKTDARGFRYVDINLDNKYTTNTDVIVSGTPPVGSLLICTTDLLGNPRLRLQEIDRGAYEWVPPSGTAVMFR
jgi:hypothetical protein